MIIIVIIAIIIFITIAAINISKLSLSSSSYWYLYVYFSFFKDFRACLFLSWSSPSSLELLPLSPTIPMSRYCWSAWNKLRLTFCKVKCRLNYATHRGILLLAKVPDLKQIERFTSTSKNAISWEITSTTRANSAIIIKAITYNLLNSREKLHVQVASGSGFASHWWRKMARDFEPSPRRSNRNSIIPYDSHLKTAPYEWNCRKLRSLTSYNGCWDEDVTSKLNFVLG